MKPIPTIRARFLAALLAFGLALAVFAPLAQAQASAPVVKAVGAVGFTVGDMDREVEFYTTACSPARWWRSTSRSRLPSPA